jgi:hypothetical protein
MAGLYNNLRLRGNKAGAVIALFVWISVGHASFAEECVRSSDKIPAQVIQYIIQHPSETVSPLLMAIQERDFDSARSLIQSGLFSNTEGDICLRTKTDRCQNLHCPLLLLAEATAFDSDHKEYWELLAYLVRNPRLNLGERESSGGYPLNGTRLLAHVIHYYPYDPETSIYASDIVDALILRKIDINREISSELLNGSRLWYKRPIQLALSWGSSAWEKCLEYQAEVQGVDCLSDMSVQYSAVEIRNILLTLQEHGLDFYQTSYTSNLLSQLDCFFLSVVQSDREATFKQEVLELLYSLGARG